MIDVIDKKGLDYIWDHTLNYSSNLVMFFQQNKPKYIAKYFLKNKSIRFKHEYSRKMFSDWLLEELVLTHWKELEDLWYPTITNGILWGKFARDFPVRAMNIRFKHKEISISEQQLMDALVPAIKTEDIYNQSHIEVLESNPKLPLIYFKALNHRITENIAEKIFKDFNKDGSTILGIEAQNWLIDNNEHIQKIIESQKLWIDFPSAIARDIFLF